jgi:GNAT superfamily N-acetyltransferase
VTHFDENDQTDGHRIHLGSYVDVDNVAQVIGTAFADLDAAAWLVPDPAERARVLARVFEIIVGHAVAHGEVHVLTDAAADPRPVPHGWAGVLGPKREDEAPTAFDPEAIGGAAVWFSRTKHRPTPAPPAYGERLQAAAGDHVDRFRRLDELFDAHHPTEPHHHLALLAVPARWQRAGRGSALLRYYHRRLDVTGTPAYLEASNLTNRALYLSHGYQPHSDPFQLPSGAEFHPMWRPPGAVAGPAGPCCALSAVEGA